MLDFVVNIISSVRLRDLIDIVIVAAIVYRILLLIKGTRAMQMLTGLGILAIAFYISSRFELFTTHWLLTYFFDYLILIIIVLFQEDLRRALTHVGRTPFLAGANDEAEREMIDEVVIAAVQLSREKTGALMVIEKELGLKNFTDTGSQLDARVSAEMLYSIFSPSSPIHDGAVIISGCRIVSAGCFLPLSRDPDIDKRYGTRHRAALGLTEETDSIVVLVSEETGEIHLVKGGKITMNLTEYELRQSLLTLFDLTKAEASLPRRLRNWIHSMSFGLGETKKSTDRVSRKTRKK